MASDHDEAIASTISFPNTSNKTLTSPYQVVPATPKKRTGTTMESPSKKTKFNDTTPVKRAPGVRLPTSVDEVNQADALIIKLREEDNKTWGEIDDALEQLTGKKPAATSTRKRYGALKASLARVKDEDLETLKECMTKVHQNIEDEKKAVEKKRYALLANAMVCIPCYCVIFCELVLTAL
jgi:hypothetical protein